MVGMIAVVIACGSANAQVPNAQTGTASPGRVKEQIKSPGFDRDLQAPAEMGGSKIGGAPEGAEKITFVLRAIEIIGANAYSEEKLHALYADRVGQTITLADLYAIAAEMTRKYRNDGYILTQIVVPPQTIDGGVAKLQVVEGYVDRIAVQLEKDARPETEASMSLIRQYAARITTGEALNVKDLERYMLLINDLPGVNARGVLSPSKTKPGAADLTILVSRDPFDGLISIDNYGTRYLGPVQLSGAASFNSLLGNNERLTAQAVVAPDTDDAIELGYVALGYDQPILSNGLRLQFNGSHTITEPGFTLDEFDVHGKSTTFSAGLLYPWLRSRATSIFATASFDLSNVDTRNNIENTRKDRIRALRVGARAEHLDTLFGAGLNVADLEISQGLDFLGASDEDDINKSRPAADPGFTKLNVELQRLQRLAANWNLLMGVRGQWSDGPLLSSEEFGVGGIAYGRAFDPSEIIGDEGVAGKLELQWNAPGEISFLHDNQLFGFYDAGRIWNDDAAAANQKQDTVTSAGFGLRSKIMERTNMDITVAVPLNRDVQTQEDRDPRVYFSLSQRF